MCTGPAAGPPMPLQLAGVEDGERGSAGHSAVRGALSGTEASHSHPNPRAVTPTVARLGPTWTMGPGRLRAGDTSPFPPVLTLFHLHISLLVSLFLSAKVAVSNRMTKKRTCSFEQYSARPASRGKDAEGRAPRSLGSSAMRCDAPVGKECPVRKGLGCGDPVRSWLLGQWAGGFPVGAQALQRRLLPKVCLLPGPWLGEAGPVNSGQARLDLTGWQGT